MSRASLVVRASIALVAGLVCGAAHAQADSNWFRQPAISPDGTQIVFCSGGDLYLVPVAGGRATPLTIHEAYESNPVWSHDGTMIAFSSDRAGNDDVFVMPAAGGAPTRLTFHSADDTPSDFTIDDTGVIFSSARMDDVRSALFPSGVLAELYSVSIDGGTPTMMLTTPALNARLDGGGQRMLYEDRKGYEDELRKHHQSAIARDLWMLEVPTGRHTKLTDFPGEDRDPQWSADGRTVYFLSERNGDFNVFKMPLGEEAQAEQLTHLERFPVRSLSRASNGTMAFSWHGDIFTLTDGGAPKKLGITIGVDGRLGEPAMKTERSGATEFVVSPNGKEIAFVVRGEVFVTSVDFSTTRRITDTPEQERSLSFSKDGRTLYYAGERDGSWNIYKSTVADDDELYFFSATKVEESPVVATEDDEFQPVCSPDGTKLAYLRERNEIRVLDVDTGASVVAVPGTEFYSYADGDLRFGWSPDSEWITTHYYAKGRIFSGDIGVTKADGSGEMINLSKSGYDDNSPAFTRDGGAVLWATARYGQRAHGGDGSEYDVVGVFLTRDAHDKFLLSKEEYELKKELEKKHKEKKDKDKDKDKDEDKAKDKDSDDGAEAADDAKSDDDEDATEDDEKVEPVVIDLDGIDTRHERLTIHASDLGGFAMSKDGDKLFYLARFEKGFDLWVHDFREESTKILAKLGADSTAMELSDDGEALFVLADGSLSKIETKGGDKKGISFEATMTVDAPGERENMFEHMWRQTKKKFYRPDMHGVDWASYRDAYEPKLAGITNNRDFAILLSEILGELNASHTGGRYRPQGSRGPTTASLGVFLEPAPGGMGERIAEVIEEGPLDKAGLDIVAGDTILAIDGVAIDATTNTYAQLNGKAGDRVRLTVRSGGGEERDVVVKPVSLGEESELLYRRWVRAREDIVEKASGGRLGYAHVRGMNDGSFRSFFQNVMGKYNDKEALIVDTRFNGGGWLHDDLATFLTGKNYVDLYPRNDLNPGAHFRGDPANRWTKPSIVVMSESNYSDAHFFPWVYTELKIGDTVGMPVPGTATAVWWERLYTGDIIFGIPEIGTKGVEGTYLENDQLEPTHKVRLDPEDAAAGTDTQLLEAVRVLLDEVDSAK